MYPSERATHQTPCIIVSRSVDDRIGAARFEESPAMENPDIITQMMRHRKVIRHHQQGEAEVFAKSSHEMDQLGFLHRVEPCGESVANQQFRFGEERSSQCDLLPLNRVEFHWIEIPNHFGKPDRNHDRFHAVMPLIARLASMPYP